MMKAAINIFTFKRKMTKLIITMLMMIKMQRTVIAHANPPNRLARLLIYTR